MKKQILFIAVTISSMLFFSCKKDQTEIPDTKQVAEQNPSITTSSVRILPLTYKLDGNFTFDQTFKDQTGQLADGIPTSRFYSFTTDRKGNLKHAIYLDSTYGVKIKSVPEQTYTSMSVWIKPAHTWHWGLSYIAAPSGYGPVMNNISDLLTCGVVTSTTIPGVETAYLSNTSWHHLVGTYDGVTVRSYMDGVLRGTNNTPDFIPTSLSDYFIGCNPGYAPWKGAIDDLRFYSRTLSATDVQLLYNQ